MPRARLPDGGIRLVKPDWAGKPADFTPPFEARIMTLCRAMPFATAARLVNLSWHRLFADADERKVRFVAEGRGADTVEAFANDLVAHGGAPDAIESVCPDMSRA